MNISKSIYKISIKFYKYMQLVLLFQISYKIKKCKINYLQLRFTKC